MSKTAITIGKFNGFHLGHQILLKDIIEKSQIQNSEMTPLVLKLVTSDSSIFDRDEEKLFLEENFPEIDGVEYIQFTPEFAAMSPEEFATEILCKKYNAGLVSVGVDFRFGKDRAGDTDFLSKLGEKYGFAVDVMEKLKIDDTVVSSSLIRSLMAEGDMKGAAKYLGRPYTLMGNVESGKKLGRTFGYPTVNVSLDDSKILPRFGVYSSIVRIFDGSTWHNHRGITNIGIRPSIDDGDKPTVETFIYEFDDDIYGFNVIIEPAEFIREERKFGSLEELTQQIARDIEVASAK